jgi:hypothetical protein
LASAGAALAPPAVNAPETESTGREMSPPDSLRPRSKRKRVSLITVGLMIAVSVRLRLCSLFSRPKVRVMPKNGSTSKTNSLTPRLSTSLCE